MENSKERRSVTAALMWRITALALGLWLFMMCCITWACALDVYRQYELQFDLESSRLFDILIMYDLSEKEQIQALVFQADIGLNVNNAFPFMDAHACDRPYEYAIICFDETDEYRHEGIAPALVDDGNYMYFYYNTTGMGMEYPEFAYVDLDETQFGRDLVAKSRTQEETLLYHNDQRYVRLTGWFEGTKFHLVEVANSDEYRPLTEEPEKE